jgi:hypothetical protein
MQISFSHNYPKLHGQKQATLLVIEKCILSKLTDEFIEYDTAYDGGHYHLAPGTYILLVFLGEKHIPFTTMRPFTEEKYRYYEAGIGKIFTINHKVS